MSSELPLVGVVSDRRIIDPHPFHVIGEKYSRALADVAGVYPVGLPAFENDFDGTVILPRLDGLLLTGSPSNIEPGHYGAKPSFSGSMRDPARDGATLALIPAALEAGLPLLAICRGFQELNVALGGTLHQELKELPQFGTHHENPDDPLDVQYGPAHPVNFIADGVFAELWDSDQYLVNSVHGQGVAKLAPGLRVEALAPDGLVEAATVRDARGFALGVQWHPEWRAAENELSRVIFQAFGRACGSSRS